MVMTYHISKRLVRAVAYKDLAGLTPDEVEAVAEWRRVATRPALINGYGCMWGSVYIDDDYPVIDRCAITGEEVEGYPVGVSYWGIIPEVRKTLPLHIRAALWVAERITRNMNMEVER